MAAVRSIHVFEVYLEGEDMATIDNILRSLVILLNLGGLKDDREFGSTIWGYDLHIPIYISFRPHGCKCDLSRTNN